MFDLEVNYVTNSVLIVLKLNWPSGLKFKLHDL